MFRGGGDGGCCDQVPCLCGGGGGVVTRSHVHGGGGGCCDQVPCLYPEGEGRCCPEAFGVATLPSPPPGLGQTDACENITFTRFAKRAVIMCGDVCIVFRFGTYKMRQVINTFRTF